ncbi:MAG: GNAT family N-acetyltransferase [Acidimicrobiia bacterium]|nr:GNAT family N-acetyltransferase [Acidimicrobiia bacterium]
MSDVAVPIPPDDYPGEWVFDVVLRDGSTVAIRPILPADGDGLQQLLGNMSVESVYQRFFRVKHKLEPDELHYFTHLDYRDRMAFVVIDDDELIGVGRYERRDPDLPVAEVAFAVVDAHQGRGIGTQLVQQLTRFARRQGISAFRAFVLADNHAMIRVFRDARFTMHRDLDEGVYTVEFPTEVSDETRAAEEERERVAVAASMMPIFYPHSVAVVGASRNTASIGGRLFKNLITGDYTGPVYPVNPKADTVRSVRAYPSVLDIPGPVDLAFIVVPARFVIDAVRECGEKGVKGLVVISAGFSETGVEGRALEEELLSVVRGAGMRMVGPNCMGVLNTDPVVSMDGQFGPLRPPRGNVAMSSQSGALGIAILDYATDLNVGISTFVSVGNKADVSGIDLLMYWEEDPATDVILLYLESFGNPRRFARIARRIAKKKPIVAVKSGRTIAGAKAASSHTGSLASLDVAADALFRQAGVIRVTTLRELFDVTALLANQPLPRGRRVAVLTNAGGPGILAVDALSAEGLEIVEFSAELQARLQAQLSPDAAVANPVDMIASAGPAQYRACLDLLFASDEVDAVMVIYIPASPEGVRETAEVIRDAGLGNHGQKTFLAVYMSSGDVPTELASGGGRVPTFPFPEQAARALAKAATYSEWRSKTEGDLVTFADVRRDTVREVISGALERLGSDGGWLDPAEVDAVLAASGLPLPESGVVATEDEAVGLASSIGAPVVLKVIAPSALHKSDVGGVVLDVEGDAAVRDAYRQVTSAVPDPEGVLVQEYVGGGHEVLIGMTEDPVFGPLIVFGLGGVFVELVGDVAFRIHPLTDSEATDMIRDVKTAQLLDGYRGGDAGDLDALRDALLRVSMLVEYAPEIVEMDMNPVKVHEPGAGINVVDARIRVRAVEGPWVPTRRDIPSAI